MHAAALADAPGAIRQLAAAGCSVDARLTGAPGENVQGGLLLELLLTDPTAPSAQGAADFAVRAGASPLAITVLALHHEAARALLAAGADARQRLQAAARRWSASLPLLMFCLTDPEAEERGAWESSADDPEHLQMLELLLEVGQGWQRGRVACAAALRTPAPASAPDSPTGLPLLCRRRAPTPARPPNCA